MSNPWKLEIFQHRVAEILDQGNMQDIIECEDFLLSSVARVGGLEKIDEKTRGELRDIAVLLNQSRARMDGLKDPSQVDDYLKSRRAFIDPTTLAFRGYQESEVFVHA